MTEQKRNNNLLCAATSDPHMKLYDGKAWDLMETREYIMYVNKRFDTEVSITSMPYKICICVHSTSTSFIPVSF